MNINQAFLKSIAARLTRSNLLINGCLVLIKEILWVHYRKAFDVVDHTILIENSLHTNFVTRLSNGLNPILMDEDRQSQMAKVSLRV